jgi:hypothetical protein
MTERKTIICLANSRKHSGRCIAGIEIVDRHPQGWVRPVSTRRGAEVSEYERQYEDGSDPRVLDMIEIPLLEAAPDGYQVENWILDPDQYWIRKGRVTWAHLDRLEADASPLWPDDAPSTYHGMNDRVTADDPYRFDHSLRLIRVDDLILRVFAPGSAFGNPKRRVQGGFTYLETEYRVWVTDPVIEREYLAKDDGDYRLGECYLAMSLGERSDDGCSYKLVAAVITRGRAEGGD